MALRSVFALLAVLSATLLVTGCGRSGDPLRPAPGVIVMDPDAEESPPAEDRPFVLDPLL